MPGGKPRMGGGAGGASRFRAVLAAAFSLVLCCAIAADAHAVRRTAKGARIVVRGTSGRDTLRGNGQDNRIYGGRSPDRLFGRAGNDAITGATGRDRIAGGGGNDALYGNEARDR